MHARTTHLLTLVCVSGLTRGCVDPLVSDAVDRSELILAPGTHVPSSDDDEALVAQIDAADGVDGDVVWALEGFWNGDPVTWWDFGEASPLPIPLYMLVREDPNGFFSAKGKHYNPVDGHPPIFDKIPGNAGYGPWWDVVMIPVTDAYQGEVLASFAAVAEAERQGLVTAPIPLPMAINCPIVPGRTRFERTPGGPLEEPYEAYWRGKEVYYFSFDTLATDGPSVDVSLMYELRREGGEPLSEIVRGVDINGDGDTQDTNDVFVDGPGDAAYSGMVRTVDVVVTPETRAIDDDEGTEIRGVSDLFHDQAGTLVPDPARVVALYPNSVVLNRPIATPATEPASEE